MRALLLVSVLVIALAGCASTPNPVDAPVVQYPPEQVFDMFEAALRYRLVQAPLRRHSTRYVDLDTEAPTASFAKRFPEYHMIMRQDLPGYSPPSPWFFIRLGRATGDHAWIDMHYQGDELLCTLVRQGDRWVVVAAKPIII